VWLVRDYIDAEEETSLLTAATSPAARWTRVSGRRLQALGARSFAFLGCARLSHCRC
jgi:hypothetical protein